MNLLTGASLLALAKSIYYIKCKERSIDCPSALMFVAAKGTGSPSLLCHGLE